MLGNELPFEVSVTSAVHWSAWMPKGAGIDKHHSTTTMGGMVTEKFLHCALNVCKLAIGASIERETAARCAYIVC